MTQKLVQKKERNDILKLIAVIAMVIDHVGAVFFPQQIEFRIIGRFSFPIFAYGIAQGFFYTSNFKNYFKKILLVGLMSQPIYSLLFNSFQLNVLIHFALSLLLLKVINDKKIKYRLVIVLLLLLGLLGTAYGIYGFLMILLYSLIKENKLKLIGAQTILIIAGSIIIQNIIRPFHFLGVLINSYLPEDKLKVNIGKYFFYWFYPLHLLLLYLIKIYIIT